MSTSEIVSSLSLYKDVYSDFYFLGAFPSDFSDLKIDYASIKSWPRVAVVFNTDASGLPGSHWTAVFVDNKRRVVEFFDSAGETPVKGVSKFIDQGFPGYARVLEGPLFQKEDVHCGVYCIFYIVQRLSGKSRAAVFKECLTDKCMGEVKQKIVLK